MESFHEEPRSALLDTVDRLSEELRARCRCWPCWEE
jgi:hypothetical protein